MNESLVEQYTIMLKSGDVAGCLKFRLKHMDNRELNRRLITVEEVHYKWVRLYLQEIQLLRSQITALQNLADGHEHNDRDKVRRGRKQLDLAMAARAELGSVDTPSPKDY